MFVALMYSVSVSARQPISHTNISGSLWFRGPVESVDKKAMSSAFCGSFLSTSELYIL
jgi:hypothetical protein